MTIKHDHRKKLFWIPVLIVAATALFGGVFLLLWNWLMPAIFGLPHINYYQALGLLILSKIIFSGAGRGMHHRPTRDSWKKEFAEKFSHSHFNTAEGEKEK